MTRFRFTVVVFCVVVILFFVPGTVSAQTETAPPPEPTVVFNWDIVVNNGDTVPGDTRTFNSYNQPSLNIHNFVVFRGRSKGGTSGEPAHGVFTRDMNANGDIETVFDRNTFVPQPNNLESTFIEPPSFPRIDMYSNMLASRANHQPAWKYVKYDLTESRAGTTGIYATPFGKLVAGGSNVGGAEQLDDFKFFTEPNSGVKFDVFPGAPAVTDGSTIVFKGNFTVNGVGKTGVYYRKLVNEGIMYSNGVLEPGAGNNPVVLIANSDTLIPGTTTKFGSTAPPSAANGRAVFAGFDNEEQPTKGGIYLAPLTGPNPPLEALIKIGDPVPEVKDAYFTRIGEGLSFDGRFVAFWGAWGTETKTLVLQCPTDGNKDRIAFCLQEHPNGFTTTVPVNQGIFVIDITKVKGKRLVARTPNDFSDFVYWNFSGMVPGVGEADEDGEPARWRSASFVAVSGQRDYSLLDATYHTVFKARTGKVVPGGSYGEDKIDGIYLRKGPGASPMVAVVKTGMLGTEFDPGATYADEETGEVIELPVTEMGIERDGFRGYSLAINISMGTEEAGWAGIYLTHVPDITY